MKKFFSFFAALLFAGSMMAETVELAAGTFNGKEGVYTEGWSTTGTGATRTDCVVVGAGENITSPTIDLSEFESVIVSIKARRFGSLSGSKAVIAVAFGELEVGTVEATGTSATTSLEDIEYTLPAGTAEGAFVFTCTNATSAGSSHGAGINSIVIKGVKGGDIPGAPTYYVCGSMTEWGVNADYELVANPANEGEFMGEFTFEAGAKLKVIKDNGTEGLTWYPDGMDNDYEITETGVYRIYFRPEGGVEGWYHGFFNVLMKEIPTYNVAEAIAAGLAENDEVFVRGVITKMEFKGKNFAKYGSVNIYVADATGAEGEFEFYNCYSLEADTFRASVPEYDPESTQWAQFTKVIDGNGVEVCVGDTVIAFGKYKLYGSTHELNTGCFLTDIKKGPDQPGETIEIQWVSTSATVKYVDNCESYGWWQVQAQNADYYITLSNAGSIASAPGTYTVADLDADYSYIEELATEKVIAFVEGSVTLSVDEEGNVFFLGEFLGDDNNTYVITIIYAAGTDTKHQYDDDSDFIVDFESYEVDETYLAQYHSVNVLALDEAGNYINLDVTLADEAEAFEAGVYPIDEEYLPQTVHAGYFDEGYLIASFAAIRTDAGISRVWYLVSGTVTVDEDLNVAVDAVNSLGHAIKVNLKSGKHQGVEAVKAENGVVKSLKNGMLLIEKNGVQFNTVGQIVR